MPGWHVRESYPERDVPRPGVGTPAGDGHRGGADACVVPEGERVVHPLGEGPPAEPDRGPGLQGGASEGLVRYRVHGRLGDVALLRLGPVGVGLGIVRVGLRLVRVGLGLVAPHDPERDVPRARVGAPAGDGQRRGARVRVVPEGERVVGALGEGPAAEPDRRPGLHRGARPRLVRYGVHRRLGDVALLRLRLVRVGLGLVAPHDPERDVPRARVGAPAGDGQRRGARVRVVPEGERVVGALGEGPAAEPDRRPGLHRGARPRLVRYRVHGRLGDVAPLGLRLGLVRLRLRLVPPHDPERDGLGARVGAPPGDGQRRGARVRVVPE